MEPLELQQFVVDVLQRLGVPYFITGSMASIYYGEPRLTNDIDIVIDLQPHQVSEFLQSFPPEGTSASDDLTMLTHARKA